MPERIVADANVHDALGEDPNLQQLIKWCVDAGLIAFSNRPCELPTLAISDRLLRVDADILVTNDGPFRKKFEALGTNVKAMSSAELVIHLTALLARLT
jgi:hypothetical protein